MISSVSIKNYKCLRDVEIGLAPFTVFVGPNASGKSSVLQSLSLLSRAFHTNDTNVEAELLNGLSRGSKDPVELTVKSDATCCRYRTHSSSSGRRPKLRIPPEQWKGDGCGIATEPNASDWKPWKLEPIALNPVPRSALLRMEASKLIPPNPSADATTMAPDGAGLHSALANMALNDPDSWQQLQADLRLIIPSIRRLRHTTADRQKPAALLFDTVGADSLSAGQISEGTLLVLGLLTALYAFGRPSLVLLDDLDRGLHPKAQKELISLLRRLLATNSDLQIIGTTHSPYMLDFMEIDEVRITFLRDEDGATVCAPLSSHPKFEKWKDEMTPGEMWSLFGEKWLAEGGTAK